jgi:hypothetical protein
LHYRLLKFVKELGVELGTFHIIISFKQERWLEPYITGNTDLRKVANNEFEKDFFKLMNNSVFGKTMENVKNRSKLHLTVKPDNAIKWFSKINFKKTKYIEGLYMIEAFTEKVVLDKPIYVGCAILDLSKLHMLRFHYNVIEKQLKINTT